MSPPDLWTLYRQMLRSRRFEEAVTRLWRQGLISGEMHLGMGEEAVVAGIIPRLSPHDALALDHRGTPPLVMRGVDLVALLREMLGQPDGLCRGMGGHMHLFALEHRAASSGIVGSAGPAAAGFALANTRLHPGSVAVAFFGEGATNQGMLLESFNLAVTWKLPVLFVCRSNNWAITTDSASVTGGSLTARAAGFGLATAAVDGTDVRAVWEAAGVALDRARQGDGPTFLLATCPHLEGHFLGDPMLRIVRNPLVQFAPYVRPLAFGLTARRGAGLPSRVGHVRDITALLLRTLRETRSNARRDPVTRLRRELRGIDRTRLTELEEAVTAEIAQAVTAATADLHKERA